MAPFATLFCFFLALLSSARGDVLYVVGDGVVSATDAGFSAVSGTTAACSAKNAAKSMASYIAGPKTTIVPVTVSLCGAFIGSDVLAGLDWIDGDINYETTNHIALGVDLDRAGSVSSVVGAHVASFVAKRAVVSTMQGYWGKAPKGVLLVPNATAEAAPPKQSPPAPPAPQAPQQQPPPPQQPPTQQPECDPVWRRVVIGESAALATVVVCLCFGLGLWSAARRRPVTVVPPSYASQSPRGYPLYQHESIRMPPFVGAGSPVPERETLSTPDFSGPRTSLPRTRPDRETASSPDVLMARWHPDDGVWEHVPTRYSRDGPYGDLGMDPARSERSASPRPPPRVSISTSGIRDVRGAAASRADRRTGASTDKSHFDFRRRAPQSPDTMSSSRDTPTNLSQSKLGSV